MPEPNYGNEFWRAKYGYKEQHQHDPPFRRNRDFKPVPYGTAAGLPNYRHAEPFALLKNAKDIINEQDHFPTRWTKHFLFGAALGVVFGQCWWFIRPVGGFAFQKVMQASGERAFSGRVFR